MTSALIIAKIFGPYLAIVGLWMLLFGDHAGKITTAIKNSPAAQYGSAVFNLLLGLIIINSYNMWASNMMLFVTLLGWVLFIRGVLGLYMPHFVTNVLLSNRSWTKVMGLVPFIWGLVLVWLGYYMM